MTDRRTTKGRPADAPRSETPSIETWRKYAGRLESECLKVFLAAVHDGGRCPFCGAGTTNVHPYAMHLAACVVDAITGDMTVNDVVALGYAIQEQEVTDCASQASTPPRGVDSERDSSDAPAVSASADTAVVGSAGDPSGTAYASRAAQERGEESTPPRDPALSFLDEPCDPTGARNAEAIRRAGHSSSAAPIETARDRALDALTTGDVRVSVKVAEYNALLATYAAARDVLILVRNVDFADANVPSRTIRELRDAVHSMPPRSHDEPEDP